MIKINFPSIDGGTSKNIRVHQNICWILFSILLLTSAYPICFAQNELRASQSNLNNNANAVTEICSQLNLGSNCAELPSAASTETRIKYKTSGPVTGRPSYLFISKPTDDDTTPSGSPNTSRARTEIKVYNQSNEYNKARYRDKYKYTWEFAIESNFKASKGWSYLFQIKAANTSISSHTNSPMIALNAKKLSSGEVLRLDYVDVDTNSEIDPLVIESLNDFKGKRLKAELTVTYGNNNTINFRIQDLSNGNRTLMQYSGKHDFWPGSSNQINAFIRPKWGLYRKVQGESINIEEVEFHRFKIDRQTNYSGRTAPEDLSSLANENDDTVEKNSLEIYPNPTSEVLFVSNAENSEVFLINPSGQKIMGLQPGRNNISQLRPGVYFVKNNDSVIKLIKK